MEGNTGNVGALSKDGSQDPMVTVGLVIMELVTIRLAIMGLVSIVLVIMGMVSRGSIVQSVASDVRLLTGDTEEEDGWRADLAAVKRVRASMGLVGGVNNSTGEESLSTTSSSTCSTVLLSSLSSSCKDVDALACKQRWIQDNVELLPVYSFAKKTEFKKNNYKKDQLLSVFSFAKKE